MKENEQSYEDAWRATDGPAIVIEADGSGTTPADLADMTASAARQLAQVAEQAANSAAESSAVEFREAWAKH